MALPTTKIDVNRSTTDVNRSTTGVNRSTTGVALPSVLVDTVIQGITESSAVMSLANRMVIPGSGVHVIFSRICRPLISYPLDTMIR